MISFLHDASGSQPTCQLTAQANGTRFALRARPLTLSETAGGVKKLISVEDKNEEAN